MQRISDDAQTGHDVGRSISGAGNAMQPTMEVIHRLIPSLASQSLLAHGHIQMSQRVQGQKLEIILFKGLGCGESLRKGLSGRFVGFQGRVSLAKEEPRLHIFR